MFKALLLQSLYGLSDAELEDALNDRLSFRRFVGLGLEEAAPDHTTICRLRNRLVEAGLLDRLFGELERQLDKAGLILRRGTMLDATLIETAAASRPPRDHAGLDPDAGFAKRSGKPGSTYGYKAHVGVDDGFGIIRRVITTPANVNDTTPADELICGDEAAVYADAAYHTHGRERALRARGVKARLMRRPNKHHPVLPPRLKQLNRLIVEASRGGGDHLRHLEAAHGPGRHPLPRPGQGCRPGAARRHGLQPAPLGHRGGGLTSAPKYVAKPRPRRPGDPARTSRSGPGEPPTNTARPPRSRRSPAGKTASPSPRRS